MILTPLQKYKKELLNACATANVAEWFERYINHARGSGCTDALIKACEQSGATLIVPSEGIAEDMRDILRIETTHVLNSTFAANPRRSVVDNGSILRLVQESRRLAVLAEQLLTLMERKGID